MLDEPVTIEGFVFDHVGTIINVHEGGTVDSEMIKIYNAQCCGGLVSEGWLKRHVDWHNDGG